MQKLSFRRWKSKRAGYTVLLDGVRVGHVRRSKPGGFYGRVLRPIGRANRRKMERFTHRQFPGCGIMHGWITDLPR
jgi:hypothetical protein